MIMIRLSSNGVPAKRTGSGKKSSIEGPSNPPLPEPSSVTRGSRAELAVRNRVLS